MKNRVVLNEVLNESERSAALETLTGWRAAADGSALEKTFVFEDFDGAFAFMGQIAQHARAMDHHPEWLNVYNRVEMRLTTHDAGGVTQKDVRLAQLAEDAFLSFD